MSKSPNITLSISDLSMSYSSGLLDKKKDILNKIELTSHSNQFLSILGPNGSGKSSLIRLIAGLENADTGTIRFQKNSNDFKPCFGVVFQEYDLFDWKTVRGNIEFALMCRGVNNSDIHIASEGYLKKFNLVEHANKYPHELSGGLKQRTAIARTLAYEPDFLLLDEPFAAADIHIRRKMQDIVQEIWGNGERAVLLVTHDVEEAVYLSDRILLLSDSPGKIIDEFDIKLTRPRTHEMRNELEFRQYVSTIEGKYKETEA